MAFIIIIDADADFADAIAEALRSAGHEVQTEPDIDSGYRLLKTRRPDLVVLDVMFPADSTAGFRLAGIIKNDPDLAGMPVLMLSAVNQTFPLGFGQQEDDPEWLHVTDFLEKPIDMDFFLRRAGELVS